MSFGFFLGQEQAGRFNDIFGAHFVPFQVCGIFFSSYADRVAVDNQCVFLHFDRAFKLTVHRVVTKHVSHVIHRNQVVDSDDFQIVFGHCGTKHQASDTAETVDTNFNL